MKVKGVVYMTNPYSLMFGREPAQNIPRITQKDQILSCFLSLNPTYQVFMLTGIRGSGKTVSLSVISKELRKLDDWIVIELNPETDLLKSLASKLVSNDKVGSILSNAKINLSILGLGAEISGVTPITDYETAINRILERMKKQGKKLLVTIDEVTNNEYMRVFAGDFQIMVRQDLPIFLLMTGLFENIDNLQNEKSLTFLYRAPKIKMEPLNLGTIASSYAKELHVTSEVALKMAKITKGYPFAFQLLGYLCWEQDCTYENVLVEFDQYLSEYVYDKIWSELSNIDKKALAAIAVSETGKIKEIREKLGMDTNHFNPYRNRLIKKGLVNGDERGYVTLVLPRFKKYILENLYDEMDI